MAGSLPGLLSGSAVAPEPEDLFEMVSLPALSEACSLSNDMRREPVDDSSDAEALEVITCALGTSDFDDYAVLRDARDRGEFLRHAIAVDLEISQDADDAVTSVIEGRADVAYTTSDAVIDALAAGEKLAVLSLLCGKGLITQEPTMLGSRAATIFAFLWVISGDYGRTVVAIGREGRT